MPELPEVETIRRGLSEFIIKKNLIKTTILCEKSFIGAPIEGEVINLRRFGKALVIDFNNQTSLMIHLRMTGQLIYDPVSTDHISPTDRPASNKYPISELPRPGRYAAGHPSDNFTAALPNHQTRVILTFTGPETNVVTGTLYFNDQRKFGFIKSLQTSEIENDPFIKKLAKEPWEMTASELYDKLQRHQNSKIKPTILDQTIIAGLGNIYADEALYESRIHPERRAGSLTLEETAALLAAAKHVMEKSIASGGSTMATYVKADGTKGDYLEKFAQVFRKESTPCPRCGAIIIKTKVAGRGTHLCPNCQKLDEREPQND